MGTLAQTNFMSIWSLSRGCSTSVVSRIYHVFCETVNGWEPLIVDTKISIIVVLYVLDSPLCEIKLSKLNEQNISEIEITKLIFCWNLLKDDTMMSDSWDYRCSSLENENTLATEMRKHFTEVATERCSSNFCLADIIKTILKCL